MAWVCECGCRYTASAPCCPECRSKIHEEDEVPNSTTGGPSYEPGREPEDWAAPGIPPEPVPEPPPARAPKADHVEYAAAVLDVPADEAEQMTKAELVELAQGGPDEGGDPSAGISSSTSESKPDKSSTTTPSGPPSPAQTTVSPSPRPRSRVTLPASSSSADSTAGSTPETGSAPSGSDES